MSRLHPTLENFRKGAEFTETERHDIPGVLVKVNKKFFTPEILKIYKSVIKESVENTTYQMVDRNFYYYDTYEHKDRWVRVFEHVERDIAVVLDVDYMLDDNVPVLSFPNCLSFYQKEFDGCTLDRYIFRSKVSNKKPTDKEIEDFAKYMAMGDVELIKLIDSRVYVL